MDVSKHIGRFPLGIWIALSILLVFGSVAWLGQALSVLDWEAALKLGLQEDSPKSADALERTVGAMEWGTACADALVQGPLVVLTLVGILRRRTFGFVLGVTISTLWIYCTLMETFQRIGLYSWGMVPDLSRAKYIGIGMTILCGFPAVVMLICLIANRDFFFDSTYPLSERKQQAMINSQGEMEALDKQKSK